MFGNYSSCQDCRTLVPYGADYPPRVTPYPPPDRPVKLLFIGWNPPSPGGGFWAKDDDHLLGNLLWIFQQLGWSEATTPQLFRDKFREKGYYFIHAVKCFSEAKFPTGTAETRILRVCANTHLSDDLAYIQPKAICALGRIPFRALKLCHQHLPPQPRFLKGAEAQIRVVGQHVPVLITCFPNGRQGPGVQRNIVLEHLRNWQAIKQINV